jgi:N-acetyl-anhydromuramyl-L-alanine amidase AmpD
MKPILTLKKWLARRKRKPGTVVSTVVMHSSAGGSAKSSIGWLAQIGYSYHAIIERDGTATKCVPFSDVAYHAGKSVGPEGANVNEYSVGICFAHRNDGKEQITEAQLDAAEQIVFALKMQFPLLQFVANHHGISPGRKFDPRGFNVEKFGQKVHLTPWKRKDAVWRLF